MAETFEEPGEGRFTGETYAPSPEEEAARRKRNVAIALAVVAFMAVVFLITTQRLRSAIEAGRAAGGPVFVQPEEAPQ